MGTDCEGHLPHVCQHSVQMDYMPIKADEADGGSFVVTSDTSTLLCGSFSETTLSRIAVPLLKLQFVVRVSMGNAPEWGW